MPISPSLPGPCCATRVAGHAVRADGVPRTARRTVLVGSLALGDPPGHGPALPTPWGPVRVTAEDDRRKLLKRLKNYVKDQPHESAMRFVAEFCAGDEPCPDGNGVLTWSELRRLHSEGVTLAAHTRTHPLLNQIPPEQAVEETLGSIADLREQIGDGVLPVIAYPSGGISPQVVSALRAAAIELGFTTSRGTNFHKQCDPLELKRINVGQTTNLGLLRAVASVCGTGFQPVRITDRLKTCPTRAQADFAGQIGKAQASGPGCR